ncbi:L-lactate dehydrogenase [Parenemella sanctibonifatiensis]|uniref:L-lactate dehydrogenase n=1 Tax=Parenemella sanctibonifatiensis TaxID=2016505 RepID=A0A255EGU2_9ACTN|nr:L-lactate dehydrogenase [Parenemella sanctibonifatiensis]OYN90191.1 L-lactate dehydrogenase [Parenemella sanctibonifatiensis]
MSTTSPKLAIVGAGAVGSSLAYACQIRGSVHEIALYDTNEAKVVAEAKDLVHGAQFTPVSRLEGSSDIGVVSGADVVVITAGARQKPGQTRMDLAAANVAILNDLMPGLVRHAPDAVVVLVTNPCDVLTWAAQKITGLAPGRVISSGTLLDTSRLRRLIAQVAGVHQSSVHAIMLGEHGDSEFPVWSGATIGQTPIRDWLVGGEPVFTDTSLDRLATSVVRAAYEVIEGKGATNHAIGLAGARLIEAIIGDQRVVLPVSSVLQDYRGVSDVALSVPSVVGRGGVIDVLEIPMSQQERTLFRASAAAVRHGCAPFDAELG